MLHLRTLAVALLAACGADPTSAPVPAAPAAASVPSAPAAAPVVEAPAAPRVELPALADLAAALRARRPTIEIVPEACGVPHDGLAISSDRICVADAATGRSRATRRVALSDLTPVSGARFGSDVVFSVADAELPCTRFQNRYWQWRLDDDAYVGIAGGIPEGSYTGGDFRPTSFGVLIHADDGRSWLFANRTLERIHLDDGLGPLAFSAQHTYRWAADEGPGVIERVEPVGGRLVGTPIIELPASDAYLIAPGGRDIAIVARLEEGHVALHIADLIASSERTLTLALTSLDQIHDFPPRILVSPTRGQYVEVDLETGAITPTELPDIPEPSWTSPEAIHEVLPTAGGIVLTTRRSNLLLTGSGVSEVRRLPRAGRSPCRCELDTLACGEARVPLACTEVQELESIRLTDTGPAGPSTSYTGDAAYRIDRLEADLLRITRLSDAARLWVRVIGEQLIAQADDGAMLLPEGLDPDVLTVRWGASILEAPVSSLEGHEAALVRPSLLADFFGGRPLPSADTTLPR